jgi:hypothetical protein
MHIWCKCNLKLFACIFKCDFFPSLFLLHKVALLQVRINFVTTRWKSIVFHQSKLCCHSLELIGFS